MTNKEAKDYTFIKLTKKQYIIGLLIVPVYLAILRYIILDPMLIGLYGKNSDILLLAAPLKNIIIFICLIALLKENIKLSLKDIILSGIKDDFYWVSKSVIYLFVGRVIYALAVIFVRLALSNEFGAGAGLEPQNEQIVNDLMSAFPIIAIVQTIFIAPIVEELIFRYLIFHSIRWIDRKIAIVFTSIFFSVLHVLKEIQAGQYDAAIFFGLSYMVIAFVLSIIYEKRRNIIFCMILHMVNNILSILV